MRTWLALIVISCLIGCGSVAATPDAPQGNTDAGIDALTIDATPGVGTLEINSGGARVTGSTYTVDVQIGHPTSQEPMTGNGTTIEGASAIKP